MYESVFSLTAVIINSKGQSCWGGTCDGTVTFSVTGIPPFHIQKNDCSGSSNWVFSTNIFTVTGLCSCASSISWSVWDNSSQSLFMTSSLPVAPQTWITNTNSPASCSSCCDGLASFTVTGGSPGFQYQLDNGIWSTGTSNYSSLCVGTHTFCTKDSKNCINCDIINIGFTTGIKNTLAAQNNFSFSNPADQILEITGVEFPIDVSFITSEGKLIRSIHSLEKGTIDIRDLPQDLYILQINSGNSYLRKKLVVIHN